MQNMNEKIKKAIEQIDAGQFNEWKGFVDGWTLPALAETTGNTPGCSGFALSGKLLNLCTMSLKRQEQPLQCFVDAAGKICLLRLEDARPSSSLTNLTVSLGEPEIKRTLLYPDYYAPATQWIYASKGITLYILENVSETDNLLLCIALYQPTTVTDYLDNLGGKETRVYFDDTKGSQDG
jgi:hypothetical protein